MRRFCLSCRRKIPSGFSLTQNDEIVIAEIERNEKVKAIFKSNTGIGNLSFDTENHLFHIDNAYYRVTELAGYSFYSSEPRIKFGLFGNYTTVADVYFSYTPIGQERRIRRVLLAAPCKYENTGTTLYIEPPLSMLNAEIVFKTMINDEYEYLVRAINVAKAAGSGEK
jgi:hypothetical protein